MNGGGADQGLASVRLRPFDDQHPAGTRSWIHRRSRSRPGDLQRCRRVTGRPLNLVKHDAQPGPEATSSTSCGSRRGSTSCTTTADVAGAQLLGMASDRDDHTRPVDEVASTAGAPTVVTRVVRGEEPFGRSGVPPHEPGGLGDAVLGRAG
jgi:hypothetical protein